MTTKFTEKEALEAEAFIVEKRLIELKRENYRKRFNRDPCCDRELLTGDCLCWQDSWC